MVSPRPSFIFDPSVITTKLNALEKGSIDVVSRSSSSSVCSTASSSGVAPKKKPVVKRRRTSSKKGKGSKQGKEKVISPSIASAALAFGRMTPVAISRPGKHDVICARGKHAKEHSGNIAYRQLIQDRLDAYSNSKSKLEKSLIVSDIVETVRRLSPNGGFVKEVDGKWYEVGDALAREKCGQSFRDLLHLKYKSSTKAKRAKRRKMGGGADASSSIVSAAAAEAPEKRRSITPVPVPYVALSLAPPPLVSITSLGDPVTVDLLQQDDVFTTDFFDLANDPALRSSSFSMPSDKVVVC